MRKVGYHREDCDHKLWNSNLEIRIKGIRFYFKDLFIQKINKPFLGVMIHFYL